MLPRKVLFYLPIVAFILITFAPIYWIVLSAFTPISDLFQSPLHYIPAHPSWVNFRDVAQILPLGQLFWNSAVLAIVSACVSVVVCLFAAYAFARIRFPGSGLLLLLLLLSGFLPGVATIIPLFQMFQSLGLIDTMRGLVILVVSLLLPTRVWIMTTFIRQIPVEMEEAAQVDGAGSLVLLWKVIIPVLRPGLATLFLINLIAAWDDFFLPLIFNRTNATTTLTLGITQSGINPQYQTVVWGNEAAMGMLVIAPVFLLAMIFQKQIVEGLMAGALKG